jgi:hypothetical protein
MKKTLNLVFAIFIAISALISAASAQHKAMPERRASPATDTAAMQLVTMTDGTKLTGRILSMDTESVTIKVNGIEKPVTLNRKMINSIQTTVETEFDAEHRGAVGLLSTQTAFMIKKGHGVYENVDVIVANHVDFGISDNVSVGMGFDFLFVRGQLKVGGKIAKNIHAAFNISAATTPAFTTSTYNGYTQNSTGNWFANGQGLFTFGNPDRFFNAGIGVALLGSGNANASQSSTISITLGGFTRINNHWGFMSDNIIFPGQTTTGNGYTINTSAFIGTAGARYLGRNASFDFGLSAISTATKNSNSYNGNPYSSQATSSTYTLILPYLGMKAYW